MARAGEADAEIGYTCEEERAAGVRAKRRQPVTAEHQDVLYDVQDQVAIITLNRPERLNALSADLTSGLAEYIERAWVDDGVRVVVLTGAGRGFCSGQDISGRTIADRDIRDDRPPSPADRRHNLRGIQRVGRAVAQLDKPYLAAVNGPAAGAGIQLPW